MVLLAPEFTALCQWHRIYFTYLQVCGKAGFMGKILCASMMCANYGNLDKEIRDLENSGLDVFHIDVMDGQFVPNFGMGLQDIEYIAKTAKKPVDVHLMIENPGEYVQKFAELGIDIIYIHPEADRHSPRTLQKIADSGAKAGIAINPGTSVELIEPLLNLVEYVLVMTVNPGFSGQKYIQFVDEKIDKLIILKDRYGYKLLIDGACSPERIRVLSSKGVDGFILGTSALFGKGKPYSELVPQLRSL
jgi:ribulose-phosphate 3-epimerase